ncbi:hypothetical protein JG688_00010034 [Phytophthora aleatoria]|uniref:Uncharacterized protein n=1 Tax=Phytophthora aleatoria TaxID=2496075 RepID=A0A8J5IF92_9STRA|nr:hypothetical protein JG688_00010034 [Phytophthora aleatoria]
MARISIRVWRTEASKGFHGSRARVEQVCLLEAKSLLGCSIKPCSLRFHERHGNRQGLRCLR